MLHLVQFLRDNIFQGSVEIQLRCGGVFDNRFVVNFSLSVVTVKKN